MIVWYIVNMDKEGLLQVLTSLLDKQPGLRHDILTYIPAPTISSALAVLNDLEKKLHASFPYNKNGPQLDHYTFSRVREPLLDLIVSLKMTRVLWLISSNATFLPQDTISQYSHHFVSSMVFPTTSFTYLDQVSHFVHRLPIWNADQHNQPRMDLYKDMALFWKQAIQMASEKLSATSTFHPDTVGLWATNLAYHNTLSKGLLGDVILEFNRCFLPTPEHHDASLSATTSLVCQSSPVLGIFPSPVIGYTDHRR